MALRSIAGTVQSVQHPIQPLRTEVSVSRARPVCLPDRATSHDDQQIDLLREID
jgi:hypothetical protein